jgi:hypothetical protein
LSPLLLVSLLSICFAVIRNSLLIVGRSVDDLTIIVRVQKRVFRRVLRIYSVSKGVFSTSKRIACVLACEKWNWADPA